MEETFLLWSGQIVSESSPNAEQFDVFLCHNSEDKPDIRQIADELIRRGLKPWLDEREIPPGKPWQALLETQIETIKTAAVFVGKSGIGPWQNMEMRAFINEFVERSCPVIPIVLPSATETPKLPILLKNLHWVDFRKSDQDPYKQLIWGITGEKPDHHDSTTAMSQSVPFLNPDGKDLLPSKAKQLIEVRLPGNVDEFSPEQQATFMQSLAALLKLGEVKVTRVVAGSIRLYLELDQEDADKLYSASKEGRLKELSISEARLYPAIAVPPDQEQHAQLEILRDRVQEYWIDGVLKQSLHHEVLISLGKHAMDEAVEPPWKHILALPEERRHLLLQDRNITTVFDATGLLLILGEPGSGKTTTLLELAAALIGRAKDDPKERVPVVLNLSSWTKNQSIEAWFARELSAKYRVPKSIATTWVMNDYLVPLLDGLDEVQTTSQPDCVAAINAFIENSKPSGMVVCCRLNEYQWFPERLKLNGAVCLEPLSPEDVNKFLEAGGSQLAGLRQALKGDLELQELSQTPLMLSIMSLACEGASKETLVADQVSSLTMRREHIFKLYVDRMFERKGSSGKAFSKAESIGWLSWLARKMREQSRSVLLVEELQPGWLSSTRQRLAYEAMTALGVGVIVGLVVGLCEGFYWGLTRAQNTSLDMIQIPVGAIMTLIGCLFIGITILIGCRSISPMTNAATTGLGVGVLSGGSAFYSSLEGIPLGVVLGLLMGLLSGLGIGSLKEIHLVEIMRWQSRPFLKNTILVTVLTTISLGAIVVPYDGISHPTLLVDLYGVLIFALILGLSVGLCSGLTEMVNAGKAFPNQGIKLSLKNSLTVLSILGVLLAPLPWLTDSADMLLFFGLFFVLSIALNRGGSAVVKHYALRLILCLTGSTPFQFISFLDHCAKLVFLKKVGGGFMFIHRTLLDYFASLSSDTERNDTSTRAAS